MAHDHVSAGHPSEFAGHAPGDEDEDGGIDFQALIAPVRRRWRGVALAALAAGAIGYGVSFLVTPLYTSHTTLIPPQQQQSGAAAALSSLGVLGSLAGGAMKNPIEQYISLMQSDTVTDRLIDRFGLMKAYDFDYRDATRKKLLKRSAIVAGKKDGLITITVEDSDPKRAAGMASQ